MLLEFQAAVHHADLLVLHRCAWDPGIQMAIDDIHSRGGRVIYDTDDLLFNPEVFKWIDSPDFQDPVRANLYREEMLRLRQCMELSDAIMTSTPYLAGQAEVLGLPTFIHRNAFSSEMLTQADRVLGSHKTGDDEKIVIGYASGTLTHNRDFETIGQALRNILDEHNRVVLWLVGQVKPGRDWMKYRSRILQLPHVPWKLLPAYLARFDINLAPLVLDNPFSQSKSEIKWMEAALVRTPTIASGTDIFQAAIKSGSTGIVALSLADWQAALSMLIAEKNKRLRMGAAAREAVLRSYSPRVRADELRLIIQKVTGRSIVKEHPIKKLPAGTAAYVSKDYDYREVDRLEKKPSLLSMAGYSLRYRGMGTLIKQLWAFTRRLVSPIIPYKKLRVR